MSTKPLLSALLGLALVSQSGRVAFGQAVTTADIQRLQESIYEASRDVAQLRGRDTTLANQLQAELDDLRDDTIYLKVKLRKNEPIARVELTDVRAKVENVRERTRPDSAGRYSTPTPAAAGTPPARTPNRTATSNGSPALPVGTEFDVRLQRSLSSSTARVEDRFEATTLVDLKQDDRVLVPAGSIARGLVSSVNKAGRIERRGSLTVAFDQVTVGTRSYPMRATVTQALESEGVKGEAAKIGTGAGVGAVIGGILGGFKGALAGILIGGGGTIAATEGKDVELPAGTVLRVRLDSGLDVK